MARRWVRARRRIEAALCASDRTSRRPWASAVNDSPRAAGQPLTGRWTRLRAFVTPPPPPPPRPGRFTGPTARRRARFGAFVAVCALVAIHPSPAFAGPFDFGDCTNAPVPESPTSGAAGFFLPTPDPLPPDEDPFQKGASTTPFEQFGFAGLTWNVYDPGCGGAVRDPGGSISTWVGRTLFVPAKAGVAATDGVVSAGLHPTYLDTFDPLLSDLTDALHRAIFSPIAPLVVMATGLLLLYRSTRQRVSDSASAVGWAVLVMMLAAAVFTWPEKAGRAADSTIEGAVSVVSSGFTNSDKPPNEQIANSLYDGFLYRMWLSGEFCDPDSLGARRYGPDILTAQALNWAELDESRQSGSQAIVEDHQKLFDDAAGRIQDEDPVAYECVAGHSNAPLESALLADIGTLLMAPFLLLAGLILIAAYVIIRFGVILAPALLTAGLFFPLRGIVTGAARIVATAIINGVVFTICGLFVIRVDTTVLDPATDLPAWLKLVLLGVVTVVMWYLTRPFRKLVGMVTPHRYFRDRYFLERYGYDRESRETGVRRTPNPELGADAPLPGASPAMAGGAGGGSGGGPGGGHSREEARGPAGLGPHRVSAARVPRRVPSLGNPAPPNGLPPNGHPGALPPGAAATVPVEMGGPPRARALAGGSVNGGPGHHDPHRVGGYHHHQAETAPPERRRTERPERSVDSAPDGLFDPAAPYRPAPEEDFRAHLRPVRVDTVEGTEVYQLYDPGDDPLSRRSEWSS